MDKRVIILPLDGMPSALAVAESWARFFASPFARKLVGVRKYNDALHFPEYGPDILRLVREAVSEADDVDDFIDLKIADVTETDKNTLSHYVPYRPSIVTVTSVISCKALMAIKEILPNTRIALVDTLTDIKEEECLERYGMTPLEKISKALASFEKLLKDDNPIDLVVCSPKETSALKQRFHYKIINAGIRSRHMAKDHQERTTDAYDALSAGADLLVMGTQLTKGNPNHPDGPISPEESQRITAEEIERFFAEKK